MATEISDSSGRPNRLGIPSARDVAIGRLAVALLSGCPPDVERGADAAMRRKLGGLFLYGLSADPMTRAEGPMQVAPAVQAALRRAAAQEAADEALTGREIEEILGLMELRGRSQRPASGRGPTASCSHRRKEDC